MTDASNTPIIAEQHLSVLLIRLREYLKANPDSEGMVVVYHSPHSAYLALTPQESARRHHDLHIVDAHIGDVYTHPYTGCIVAVPTEMTNAQEAYDMFQFSAVNLKGSV